jgi:hypothetical protein
MKTNLLNRVRNQLADASIKQWFSVKRSSNLNTKSAKACPNIELVDLMLGTQSFIATPEMEKQELLYFIDFFNVMLNEVSAK